MLFIGEPQEERIVVPDSLLEELVALRLSHAMLLNQYKKELQSSPEAQEKFVEIVSRVLGKGLHSEHDFQAYFETLINKEVSLFNITYLKQFCVVFPEDVW